MKKHWFLETWVIAICFFFGVLGIPAIIGIILIILRAIQDRKNLQAFNELQEQNKGLQIEKQKLISQNKELIEEKQIAIQEKQATIDQMIERNKEIGLDTYEEVKSELENIQSEIQESNTIIDSKTSKIVELNTEIQNLEKEVQAKEKQVGTQINKIRRIKDLYKSIEYYINNFLHPYDENQRVVAPYDISKQIEELSPTVTTKLHAVDIKELRTAFKDNNAQIDRVLNEYSSRYTTKANIAIYKLMVIALRAELQNILSNLKYEKLDDAIQQVQTTTAKYLKIAGDGNQTIVTTLTKFIGQIEYLFINAVKIEYNYYVKKEQAKQEQLALREQMRQEAEERKALEAERKKIEKEEEKYHAEIDKLNEQMTSASDTEIEQLKARILELQSQLSDVIVKKEEIATLANGKAGNVYIISNLGSFGENVFKIGMTRRLDPQDRVNELGSASVPFKFDVHSFIFSDDAVSLENKLHTMLNNKRVNKVNLRKEFFYTTIDELETLVNEIEPTAEFNRTMIAEEFRQSQSSDEVYSVDESIYDDEEE